MIRRCPRCTEVLPVTAMYCRRCGAAQSAVQASSPIIVPQLPQRSRRQWITLFVLIGLLPLALLFFRGQLSTAPTPAVQRQPPQIVNVPAAPSTPIVVYPSPPVQREPVYVAPQPQPVYSDRSDHDRRTEPHTERGRPDRNH